MAGGKFVKMLAETVQKSGLDMSEAARMQRARDMGFSDGYQHTSKTRFIGGQGDDFGTPREEAFRKKNGGNYFSKIGESEVNEKGLSGDFGETSDYMLRGNNKIDATWKGMNEEQKKEIKDIVNNQFSDDDIGEIRQVTGDDEWEPFDSFISGELWADAGRGAQDRVMNDILKKYDLVRFKDNPTYGVESYSTVVRDPNQIRSINAAFDPAQKESSNLMASALPFATVGGVGLASTLSNDAQAAQSNVGSIQAPSRPGYLTLAQKAAAYNRMREERLHPLLNMALPVGELPEGLLRKLAYGDDITIKDRIMAALGLL